MPILLAPDKAISLVKLLDAANKVGLKYELIDNPRAISGGSTSIAGIGSLSSASNLEISFLSNRNLHKQLSTSQAAAIILSQADWESYLADNADNMPSWIPVLCEQVYVMYALLAHWFDAQRINDAPAQIHPSAVVATDAKIAADVAIGALTVIESGVEIKAGTRIGHNCTIGANSTIGENCLLHSNVTLYHSVQIGDRVILHSGVVIGADGFGFAPDPRVKGAWAKIAQLGSVTIGNDVEIGANTTVDRGALENTVIDNGVKLDNQIMIGHNCQIGEHTAMAACVGVAGSTTMGKRCVIGGAAMFGGHLTLADDVHISGGTAVTNDVLEPGRYTGVFPLAKHQTWQHNAASLGQLAQLRKRLRSLEFSKISKKRQD